MSAASPGKQCSRCKHLRWEFIPRGPTDGSVEAAGVYGCAAYPDGVPNVITQDEYDHRERYEGDHGILWEPIEPGVEFPKGVGPPGV